MKWNSRDLQTTAQRPWLRGRRLGLPLIAWGLLTGGAAHASVTELFDKLAGVMRQFPPAPGATSQDKERRLILNGQPLNLLTGHTQAPVQPTLDFYRQRFDERAQRPKSGLRMLGIQKGDTQAGYLVMVDPDSRAALLSVAKQRQPLTAAGPLRMVYAQRRGDGTDYLLAWTSRALPAEALRPLRTQDSPGQDIPAVPRPPGGIRSLSVFEPAAGYGLVSYQVEAPREQALRAATEQLRSAGFHEDPALRSAADSISSPMTQLIRQGHTVLLSARARANTGSEVTYLWHTR